MTGFQNIKRQLLPLIKGLPIVIGCFLVALFLARKIIDYSPNVYQTMAKIKLDDQERGLSNNDYYRSLEVFSTENIVESEAEILKSPLILSRMIDSSNFNVMVYRKGKVKNTMLYQNIPFEISYDFEFSSLYDQPFVLEIKTDSSFSLNYTQGDVGVTTPGTFGTAVNLNGGHLTIQRNDTLLQSQQIELLGTYEFKIFSKEGLIAHISQHLDVKAVNKDIAILRVVYRTEDPQKVADVTNAICKAYIEDYVSFKSNSANKTVRFIEEKLDEVTLRLENAERKLEAFKIKNNVVNTLQETETGLREISKLNVQLINLEMQEATMIELQSYIENGAYFDETAINFGFGDLLMTELVKKLKVCQDERHDLLIKYKPDSENVKALDTKIEEIKTYIKEAIRQNLKEIQIKRQDIEQVVEKASHQFDDLPTREKSQHILEREFKLLEDVYNFLSQKKIEASIASTAMLSFHRVIQPAIVPQKPVAPNRTLITFVAGLLGLIIGITVIYFRKYINAKVVTRDDIEKHSVLPVGGVIRHQQTDRDFEMLVRGLMIKGQLKKGQVLGVSSTLNGEGKTYLAKGLAKTLMRMGYTTCVVDTSVNQNPKQLAWQAYEKGDIALSADMPIINYPLGQTLSDRDMDQLKNTFDFVIVDSTATAVDISGVEAIKKADLSFYVIRANHTDLNYVAHADILQEEFQLEGIFLVLNDAHLATSYSGNYIGSRFIPSHKPRQIFHLLFHYYKTYLKR